MTPDQIRALLIAEAAKHGVDITKPGELERRLQAAKIEDELAARAERAEPEFDRVYRNLDDPEVAAQIARDEGRT